jgi:capsular exopolysaccharide synthesis family protein
MSRVEEALKRAGRTDDRGAVGPQVRPGDVATTDRQPSSGTTIADYPCESPRPDFPREAPAPEHAPKGPVATRRAEPVHTKRPAAASSVTARVLRRLSEAVDGKVVIDQATSAVSIEEYRRLAATLHGLQVQSGIKTVIISSALPRDGKTLTTTNLALTLSESYKLRVLVIDADLRRPSIHEVFSLPNHRGLAEGLRESDSASLPALEVSPTLAVLTAGIPDRAPMAGLTSQRMKELLAEASARFDWVLLDTPPIGLISDAQLLASLVDGVILVVGAGSTDYRAITHTVSQLGRERIIGVVLNRVVGTSTAEGYYHDYYRADHSSGTGMNP